RRGRTAMTQLELTRRALLTAGASLAAAGAASLVVPASVFGFHYSPDIPIGSVGGATANGTLVEAMPIDVLSVGSFTRAINQAHGTQVVLSRNHFTDGQSTGWHTHPGPNITMIVSGAFWLLDDHCDATHYGAGEGFATGLKVHEAVADGATEF